MGHNETFGGDGNNHYDDRDDGLMCVYMYQITSNYAL